MITAIELANSLTEEVAYEQGPCIYPGSFKPPHKGHFDVVRNLASRNYIKEVYVVISEKERDGITAQQSLKVWEIFLKANPIPKVSIEISPYRSPVHYAYKFIEARPDEKVFYVAGGKESVHDKDYFISLQKRFGDKVLTITLAEELDISASYVRTVLKSGNYEKYKECVPEAVNNKGYTQELFKLLAPTITEESIILQPLTYDQQIFKFYKYCCDLLEIETLPQLIPVTDPDFLKTHTSFGCYSPSEKLISVYISNRHLVDVLRTLAHELVHHKQNEFQQLTNESGETGSDIENEANAVAAMIMRNYGRENPLIYTV